MAEKTKPEAPAGKGSKSVRKVAKIPQPEKAEPSPIAAALSRMNAARQAPQADQDDPRAAPLVDPQAVHLDDLRREHPDRVRWAPHFENFRLVYRGGQEFEAAAADTYTTRTGSAAEEIRSLLAGTSATWGGKPARRFLHQMEGEPDNAYARRWTRSVYVGYVGPIIDYFTGWLFSQPPVFRPEVEEEEAPIEGKPPAGLLNETPAPDEGEEGADEESEVDGDGEEPDDEQEDAPAEDADLARELDEARAAYGADAPPSTDARPPASSAPDEEEIASVPPLPDWFGDFGIDCDGKGTRFEDFVRDRFRDALQLRTAGWLIASPAARMVSEAAAERLDTKDGVRLIPFSAEQIIDWDYDEAGRLVWVKLRRVDTFCHFPGPRMQIETYYYVSRTEWHTWAVTSAASAPQSPAAASKAAAQAHSLRYLDGGEHDLGEVPFVPIEIPHGLWVMNKLYSSQVNLFNQWSMLIHGQLLGAYLQPVLITNEEGASGRVFGEGTLIKLRAGGNGMNAEDFKWVSANTTPLDFNAKQIVAQRDEMYRIVHQMSLAVDATAIKDLARSGESKKEDRLATKVVLNAFGSIVRDAMRRTLNLTARAIDGDSAPEIACLGFDSFEESDLADDVNATMLMNGLNIPSKTFKRVQLTELALKAMRHADEATKARVAQEIEEGIEQEAEAALMNPGGLDPFGQPMPGGDPFGAPEGMPGEMPPDGDPEEDPDLAAELEEARGFDAGGEEAPAQGGEPPAFRKRRKRKRGRGGKGNLNPFAAPDAPTVE